MTFARIHWGVCIQYNLYCLTDIETDKRLKHSQLCALLFYRLRFAFFTFFFCFFSCCCFWSKRIRIFENVCNWQYCWRRANVHIKYIINKVSFFIIYNPPTTQCVQQMRLIRLKKMFANWDTFDMSKLDETKRKKASLEIKALKMSKLICSWQHNKKKFVCYRRFSLLWKLADVVFCSLARSTIDSLRREVKCNYESQSTWEKLRLHTISKVNDV